MMSRTQTSRCKSLSPPCRNLFDPLADRAYSCASLASLIQKALARAREDFPASADLLLELERLDLTLTVGLAHVQPTCWRTSSQVPRGRVDGGVWRPVDEERPARRSVAAHVLFVATSKSSTWMTTAVSTFPSTTWRNRQGGARD